jgi:Glyoxalase-like domain
MISRRLFLSVAGLSLASTRLSWPSDRVPGMLDHILLGCNDLDRGVAYVEKRTGVRAAIGGVHPGAGTRNALLSLGERRYLEIIAPDPSQKNADSPRLNDIRNLNTPKVIEWAAHVEDIEAVAKRLRQHKVGFEGPNPGSRKRPDGRILKWKTLGFEDDRQGLLPFLIQWDADSPHPSTDAPKGCVLESFSLAHPEPASIERLLNELELDARVLRSPRAECRWRSSVPKARSSYPIPCTFSGFTV